MGPPHGLMTRDPTAALLPPCFFVPAVAAFAGALGASPFLLRELDAFFYQPHVLALTHVLTLGWVSLTIQGVLYRYVPGLTKQAIPYPRLAVVQWATFVAGSAGLVTGFWIHRWPPTVVAAALLVVSSVLLCVEMWPMLRRAPRRGVAEVGLFLSTALLVVAATLGMLLAADKLRPLVRGSMLTNLGAHAHLAALGWVGTTIAALSFRFLPAFLLPSVDLTATARRLVVALAAGVVILAIALLAQSDAALGVAAALATLVIVYAVLVLRLVAHRGMPMDWTAWHAVAGAGWVTCSGLAGLVLAAHGIDDQLGARLAAAYGVAAIVGWMSNLIVGVSYKLFPGFVAAARAHLERPPVPFSVLGTPPILQPVVFATLNGGTLVVVLALLGQLPPLLELGGGLLAMTGLAYASGAARTLLFTVRDREGVGTRSWCCRRWPPEASRVDVANRSRRARLVTAASPPPFGDEDRGERGRA